MRTRHGVSEVISAVLLLGITVAGAAMVSAYLQDSNVADVSSFTPDIGAVGSSVSAIKLISYDARDTPSDIPPVTINELGGIPGLYNSWDGMLCTVSCSGNVDNLPTDNLAPGTEFIVLIIRNNGLDYVTLRGLVIEDEVFPWDSLRAEPPGNCLDVSVSGLTYPRDGYFSIVGPSAGCPGLQWEQKFSNVLFSGNEVTLLVKLSSTLNTPLDLPLNQPLRIKMDTEKVDVDTLIIVTGLVK